MKLLKYAIIFCFFNQLTAMEQRQNRRLQLSSYKQKKRIYTTQPTNERQSEVVIEIIDVATYTKRPKKSDCFSLKKSCFECVNFLIKCLFPSDQNNIRED